MTEDHQAETGGEAKRRERDKVPMRELPRHWGRDWKQAYSILVRDELPEKGRGVKRPNVWRRARALFRGVFYKLSPARRALFVICLVLALLGRNSDQDAAAEGDSIFLFISILGLVFLLILELADRVEVRDELEVARQLQRDLLPSQAPPLGEYDFAFSYRSANMIGGDYYDFLPLEDGRLALVVGDASGHGMAAALLMAIANTGLQLALDADPAPVAVARTINRALVGTGGPRAFMTLFFGLLEPESGRLDYVCAGHPFPLLRRGDGEVLRLGTGSYPLGIRPELELVADSAEIRTGDLLLLYTDGIPEAVDEKGESFGYERLQESLEPGGSPRRVHDRVLAELARFEGDRKPLDDRSLVVVGRRPTGKRRETVG